jgi:uncharacterized protein YndB with AHSA1/START domain
MPDESPEQRVTREIEIDASPEEVWEAVATEEGRERWLEHDPDREIHVEQSAAVPGRIVWWWWSAARPEQEPHRIELLVVAAPHGTRVVVTETASRFPVARLQLAFATVAV